jgi:hypothetical protein
MMDRVNSKENPGSCNYRKLNKGESILYDNIRRFIETSFAKDQPLR